MERYAGRCSPQAKDLGVREYGYNALLALRLEKSFGIWSAEFTQAYTPRMTGMDRWIAWDKGEFVGRKAALAERDGPPPSHQLVTLEIDAVDADASGYEPVWRDGRKVGFVTSGGYGHSIGRSLAMALVAPEGAAVGTELTVHIVGAGAQSPRDPALAIRSRRKGDAGVTTAALPPQGSPCGRRGRSSRQRQGDARGLARPRARACSRAKASAP